MTRSPLLELAAQSADAIRTRFDVATVDAALVLGSGWSGSAHALGTEIGACPLGEIPGFSQPVVAGHGGELVLLRTLRGRTAMIYTGRTHYYEGRGTDAVVHSVRTAAALGAGVLVLTNGCGGVRPEWGPGTIAAVSDHINLTGATPLHGATFIDMTDAYSPRLRALAAAAFPQGAANAELVEGVYAQFAGPQYETPAEVRMAGILGADLVGMSTALETIAAREAGLEVLALSLVTNAAAGVTGTSLNHAEVLAAGRDFAPVLSTFLTEILDRL